MPGGSSVGFTSEGSPAVEDVAGELLAEVVQDEALHVEIQRLVDSGREHRCGGGVWVVLIIFVLSFLVFWR